jgi:transcriptional regulator with XRE-family HTH domain
MKSERILEEEQELVRKLRYEDKLKLEDIAEKLNRSVYWVYCRLSDKYKPAASKRFEILKEESFNLDFVKDVLKNTNNPHRDKYLEVFNSEGLSTDKYKFHDIWEDFAEFTLSKDFELYKINRDIDYGDPFSEKTQELSKKYSHKRDMILCDILKRKYEFEQFEERQHEYGKTERNGTEFYFFPLTNYVFFLPKDEMDNTEYGRRRLNGIEEQRKTGERHIATSLIFWLSPPSLERFLTPAEKDEYMKECKKIQEGIELNIQRVETIYGSYTSVLAKSNLTLSDDELQFLKELITTQTPTFDFLGVTKPNSSFSRPLYFIEVKSRSAKTNAGYARVSPVQRKFIEKVKEKFGILVFLIELKPDKVIVKFFSPK